jgi:GT2 family glycosyltransferase
MASIDIIIVNYRSAKDTQMALAALYPWQHGNIIVVENSDDKKETEALKEVLKQFPETNTLIAEKNLGFAGGCNLAFEHSQAEHILLLNPDAVIHEASILKMHQSMQQDDKVGAVTPNIFWDTQFKFLLPTALPPTPFEEVKSALSFRFPALGRKTGQRYCGNQRKLLTEGKQIEVPFITGAILLLRRSAVTDAGGLFDPRFFMFYEDSDLSIRLRKAGYRLLLNTDAIGVHAYRHKSYKLPMMEQTRSLYFAKNFPLIWRLGKWIAKTKLRPKALGWEHWDSYKTKSCATLKELSAQLGEPPQVLALSPSPAMVPSLISASAQGARMTEQDWDCLEPGQYMMQLARSNESQWVAIEITDRSQ